MIIAGSSVADDVSESDKFETTAISRLSARGFSSGLFFDEEEAGNIERDVFNPESLENALQYQLHLDEGHSTAIESNLDVPKDAAATPQAQVPTIRVWVYDHTFSPRTLLMRRLHHLRQMHVLHELERADAFDATRPLITPALHITPEFHGLCRVAEQGIIGGWTDLDRPEPRFVTHFCGSPARLFKEERAILGEAFQREILTVDELNYREALEVVEV
ncbi:hypothetical protein C8Q79DRAFT_461187 [Trametes meyenii]|nr:hypothetical protein C8Q79DRAFT_461187 [Trametes meyenii]